jgi:hypothetical protein
MSRRTFRFVLAVLAVAGGLALGAPNAEAAGGLAREEADIWSRALRWATHLWEESVVRVWETEGWMIDPNGSQAPVPSEGTTSDEGWMIDPNG